MKKKKGPWPNYLFRITNKKLPNRNPRSKFILRDKYTKEFVQWLSVIIGTFSLMICPISWSVEQGTSCWLLSSFKELYIYCLFLLGNCISTYCQICTKWIFIRGRGLGESKGTIKIGVPNLKKVWIRVFNI